MAKKVPTALLKLQVVGGQATPAPPVGPALSQHGVNIGQFIKQFNEKTQDLAGVPLPVVIRVYRDRTFDFEVKSPPASYLLKQAAGVVKGSGAPNKEKVGKVSRRDVVEIAKKKLKDLNARDVEHAVRIIEGTARSCGIEIEG